MDFGGRTEAKIQLFQNMVMLYIKLKGNYTCMNMVANILPVDHLPGVDQRLKIPLFHNMVMLHIKIKGMMNAATRKHIFCPYTHTLDPWVGSKVQTFFSEIVMFHIKFIGIEHRASTIKAYILSLHTPSASGSTVLCCISN